MGLLNTIAGALGSATGSAAGAVVAAPSVAVSDLSKLGEAILDRVSPDPQVAAQLKLEYAKLDMQQFVTEAGVMQSVSATNTAEASNSNAFVSGWRPFIGWVCGASMSAYYIPRFFLADYLWVVQSLQAHTILPFPDMGIGDIVNLTGSMLGLAMLRSSDKRAGVAS